MKLKDIMVLDNWFYHLYAFHGRKICIYVYFNPFFLANLPEKHCCKLQHQNKELGEHLSIQLKTVFSHHRCFPSNILIFLKWSLDSMRKNLITRQRLSSRSDESPCPANTSPEGLLINLKNVILLLQKQLHQHQQHASAGRREVQIFGLSSASSS